MTFQISPAVAAALRAWCPANIHSLLELEVDSLLAAFTGILSLAGLEPPPGTPALRRLGALVFQLQHSWWSSPSLLREPLDQEELLPFCFAASAARELLAPVWEAVLRAGTVNVARTGPSADFRPHFGDYSLLGVQLLQNPAEERKVNLAVISWEGREKKISNISLPELPTVSYHSEERERLFAFPPEFANFEIVQSLFGPNREGHPGFVAYLLKQSCIFRPADLGPKNTLTLKESCIFRPADLGPKNSLTLKQNVDFLCLNPTAQKISLSHKQEKYFVALCDPSQQGEGDFKKWIFCPLAQDPSYLVFLGPKTIAYPVSDSSPGSESGGVSWRLLEVEQAEAGKGFSLGCPFELDFSKRQTCMSQTADRETKVEEIGQSVFFVSGDRAFTLGGGLFFFPRQDFFSYITGATGPKTFVALGARLERSDFCPAQVSSARNTLETPVLTGEKELVFYWCFYDEFSGQPLRRAESGIKVGAGFDFYLEEIVLLRAGKEPVSTANLLFTVEKEAKGNVSATTSVYLFDLDSGLVWQETEIDIPGLVRVYIE